MKLYPHQKEALNRMHNGCILNGVPGSGKSLTALCYYYELNGGNIDIWDKKRRYVRMKKPMDLYIITTAKKRDDKDWEAEMSPFLLSTDKNDNLYSNTVVVDSWNNIQKYVDVTGAFFIFDEQRVVGKGKWANSFIKIARHNQWILASATPGDCWGDYIPVFIANGFYRNRTEFEREHIVYKRFSKFLQIDRYLNTGKLIRLRNRLLIDMDYHPTATTHTMDIPCEYDKVKYKKTLKERFNYELNEPFKSAGELCLALRKVVNSDVSRSLALLDIYSTHRRLIVFYCFDYELDILRALCEKEDIPYGEWNGHKHQEIPETNSWMYIVQYTAGCEGWNCVRTDTTVFYSQTYSFKQHEQAMGRINRITTPYTDLYYYNLVSSASIDIAIKKALKNKRDFNAVKFTSQK